ncbi:MAG: hypothetical protein KGZ38_09825 [Erysipelothrix sp.]|nr:hypothetical protein [Erysipelothrix sp.]
MLKNMFKAIITSMLILATASMITAEPISAPNVSIDPVLGTSLVSETLKGTSVNVTGFVTWTNGYVFQTSPQNRTITGLRSIELKDADVQVGILSFSGPTGMQPEYLPTRGVEGAEFEFSWLIPSDVIVGDKFSLTVVAQFTASNGSFTEDEVEIVEIIADVTVYVIPMAAPNVAELILKYNNVNARYGQGRTGGNYIQEVAHFMGKVRNSLIPHPTDFNSENKEFYNETEDRFEGRVEYREAVLDFLNGHPLLNELEMPCDVYFNSNGEEVCP